MEYTILKDGTKANGTSLKGYMEIEYDELVLVLGLPRNMSEVSGDGKTQAEWIIEDATGEIATIYDWKEPYGNSKSVTLWHIGGHKDSAIDFVKEVLLCNLAKYKMIAMDEVADYILEQQEEMLAEITNVPKTDQCPHGKEIKKGRPVRCIECYQ